MTPRFSEQVLRGAYRLFLAFVVLTDVSAWQSLIPRNHQGRHLQASAPPAKPLIPPSLISVGLPVDVQRRAFLDWAGASFLAFTSAVATTATLTNTEVANAVAPISSQQAEAGIGLPRWQRPSVPAKNVQRQQMDHDFAILLTRASHLETVQLDIGPANQLERDMYLIRTAEQDPYRQSLPDNVNIILGDLTDPYYFDYFSFVQYETLNRAIQQPESEYEEEETIIPPEDAPSSTVRQVVKHHVSRTVADDQLVATHDQRVGKDVLDYLLDHNKGSPLAIPIVTDRQPTMEEFQKALTQLTNLFVISGFAWQGHVSEHRQQQQHGTALTTFALTLNNPATLWSAQTLAKQKAPLRNDYLLKTAVQLATMMGLQVVKKSVQMQRTNEVSYLTVVG